MKWLKKIACYGVIFFCAFFVLSRFEPRIKERYPLEDEFQAIRKEFFRYYLNNQQFPDDLSFLSETSREVLQIYSDQFEWDEEEKSLEFTYREPVTYGPFWARFTTTGTYITADHIDHNANLYRENGRLF